MPDAAPFSPPGQAEPAPARRGRGCLFYGCLSSVVLLVLLVGGCALALLRGRSEVKPICDEFIAATDAGRYQEVYAGLAGVWKTTQSEPDFVRFQQTVHQTLGRSTSSSLMGLNLMANPGQSTATVTYDQQYERGTARLVFTLVTEQGRYAIAGARYDSPQLVQTTACPACKAANPPLAKFCGACGAAMERGPEPAGK